MHVLSGDLWAGAEVMVWTLLDGLCARRNVSLRAILLNEGGAANAIRKAGVDVCVLDENQLTLRQILFHLRKQMQDFSPQIVHAHRYKENLLCYAAAFGMHPKPVLIATQHGMPEALGNSLLRNRLIGKGNFFLLSRFFDTTVAVSLQMRGALVSDHGFRPEKSAVIYNGICLPETFGPLDSGTFRIGTCGRMVPVKNYAFFLQVAAKIAEVEPGIRFILAGDGPEMESLKHSAARLGLADRLSMPGHVDDMDSFYKSIDLYLNTSIHEGIPMSVLEAMAYGVPVAVPQVGGLGEIVDDGKDGFLISPNNSDLFVERCLQIYSDRQMWIRMSKAAREKIENKFSMDRMTDAYLSLYKKLVIRN